LRSTAVAQIEKDVAIEKEILTVQDPAEIGNVDVQEYNQGAVIEIACLAPTLWKRADWCRR